MSQVKTDKEIMQFIIANPEIGRKRLSEMFNISESHARYLKVAANWNSFNEITSTKQKPNVSEKDVAEYLKQQKGLSVDDVIKLLTPEKTHINKIGDSNIKEFSIGIIGDTHLCDKACAIDELHDFYNKCKQEGVQHVVHAGDLVAGVNVYKGMTYDLSVHGFADQLKYVVENYPQIQGITTHIISGNHDLSFKQAAGANIVEEISNKRQDINWVGDYDANILINGVSVGLHHGAGGSAYAISYKISKQIEKIGAGQKPQIYILGHYHAALSMLYRNIHAYLPGCFQKANDFSVRLGLPNMVCGYIVHLKTLNDEKNSIRSIKSELITYY